jgi:hypothetical protein
MPLAHAGHPVNGGELRHVWGVAHQSGCGFRGENRWRQQVVLPYFWLARTAGRPDFTALMAVIDDIRARLAQMFRL